MVPKQPRERNGAVARQESICAARQLSSAKSGKGWGDGFDGRARAGMERVGVPNCESGEAGMASPSLEQEAERSAR